MRKPNLLFIYTDQQAAGTMAAYGNERIETPNLDRLADESTAFERAYVSQPVCTPSRSTILTGLYPHQTRCTENNIPLPADTPCLPELGDFSGYRTAHFGKWHLGDEIFAQHGFTEWRAIEDGYRGYYGPEQDRNAHSSYYHRLVEQGFEPQAGRDGFRSFPRGFCARLPEEFGKPAYLALEASRFIRDNRERPFILYVNFLEPHMPYFGPRDDQYDPNEVPLPPNFDAVPGPEQPLKLRLFHRHYQLHGHSGLSLGTEADWRRMIANYWGLCSLVDTHVGTILDTLDQCGLTDDTIVVYTSDHGDMMGSHQLLAKCTQHEEAVRVPLMLRVPWLGSAPRRHPGPVSQIDLVPTLLDLLGQPIPGGLLGASWRPFLEGRRGSPQRDVFIEWNGPNNGLGDIVGKVSVPEHLLELASPQEAAASITDPVRTVIAPDGWKLNCSPLGEHELYNLTDDPGETRNVVRDAGSRELVRELYDRLRGWQKQVADPVDLSGSPIP
jgi:arylsulfatase